MNKENLKETNCGNIKVCCTICDSEIDVYNGDIQGCFGIMKVAFCVWCLTSIEEMVYNLSPKEQIEE